MRKMLRSEEGIEGLLSQVVEGQNLERDGYRWVAR